MKLQRKMTKFPLTFVQSALFHLTSWEDLSCCPEQEPTKQTKYRNSKQLVRAICAE